MYFPLHNTCAEMTSIAEEPSLDELYAIDARVVLPPGVRMPEPSRPFPSETGETAWKFEQRAGATSLMTTASDSCSVATRWAMFRAFDQETGEVLWEVSLGSHITGYPRRMPLTADNTLRSARAAR